MRVLGIQPFIVVILVFFLFLSCNKTDITDGTSTNTFLEDIIGVDKEERVLLYNGKSIDVTQESLLLDNDEIILDDDTLDQIKLGELYQSAWKDNPYRFFRTELPILKVQTRSGSAIKEIYESSQFALIEDGQITLKGNLGIKLRGNTSLLFPKKSYRIELWEDEEGLISRDAEVLNMRNDDDWLLDGMWNEPLSIRDKSAMELWLDYGSVQDVDEEEILLGAAREYCELFIDGAYKGLYYIGERLDRKQLKLERCTNQSDGGELYKAKGWGQAVIAFSLPTYDNSSLFWGGYEIKLPQETGKYDWQKLKEFIEFFKGNVPDNFENTYPQKVDVDNIIDYFILINITAAFDNTGNNVYIARKNQSSPYYFVSWDYDATLGIGINGEIASPENRFMHHTVTRRLWLSQDFQDQLKTRWENLRSNQLTTKNIKSYYQNNYSILLRNRIYEREEMITNLEKALPGPAPMIYLEEILEQRLAYLDEEIEKL